MRLGLGTAQFGLDYGLTNPGGRTGEREVAEILDFCELAGVSVLDTAPAYGVSEEVLGRSMRGRGPFEIVTKTLAVGRDRVSRDDVASVVHGFESSRSRLRTDAVHGLLVHRAGDLTAEGGDRLADALIGLRDRGLVRKIGVSVYSPDELSVCLDVMPCSIVQLPANLLDRRFVETGWIAELHRRGVEVHVRSIFLQGALLVDPEELGPWFAPVRRGLQEHRDRLARLDLGPVDAAMAAVGAIPGVDCAIVGVTGRGELEEIHRSFLRVREGLVGEIPVLACHDPQVIDPSTWPNGGTRR